MSTQEFFDFSDTLERARREITTAIEAGVDDAAREALIAQGWTPPASAPQGDGVVPDDTLGRLLVGRATEGDQLLAHNALAALRNPTPTPALADNERIVTVDKQGVRFGKNIWISHERISGRTAEQLNGRIGTLAAGYAEWVAAHPIYKDRMQTCAVDPEKSR